MASPNLRPHCGTYKQDTTKMMNTIEYTALTDINAYLQGHPFEELNREFQRELTSDSAYCGLYEPLYFLNMLHAKFVLVRANRLDENTVLQHLRGLEMGYGQRHYLYYCLKRLIDGYIKTAQPDCSRGMSNCKYSIDAEMRRISMAHYNPEMYQREMEGRYIFEGKEKELKHYNPSKDLDAYMDTPLNLEILHILTDGKEWDTTFDPLTFYKLLYKKFEIVCDNRERPIALKAYLLNQELDGDRLYFFLHFLLVLIGNHANNSKAGKETDQLRLFTGMLDWEYQKLREQRQKEGKPLILQKEIEQKNDSSHTLDGKPLNTFALSTKNGAKTDLVRLLNAIYQLKLIHTKDGMLPTKDEFMRSFGEFLGTDLEGYSTMLSRAVHSTGVEANMKVFRELSEYMEALLGKGLEDTRR
jgi:hypothetical protein